MQVSDEVIKEIIKQTLVEHGGRMQKDELFKEVDRKIEALEENDVN